MELCECQSMPANYLDKKIQGDRKRVKKTLKEISKKYFFVELLCSIIMVLEKPKREHVLNFFYSHLIKLSRWSRRLS